MIAELGLAALWLAAALAALQLVCGALATRTEGEGSEVALITRPAAVLQGALAAFSFAMLICVFAITDLSVKLVATNSHAMKPMVFKIAGAWGNHEGSMLLWVTFARAHHASDARGAGLRCAGILRLPAAQFQPVRAPADTGG
jgi:cytochrome c-type biogenesis protein CcmF